MAAKFKDYFERMLKVETDALVRFEKVHDDYSLNPAKWQAYFNEEGEKAMSIFRHWDNLLCSQSEKGGYGVYTSNLSEKFWGLIRTKYPMVDRIGLKTTVSETKPQIDSDFVFNIKKINLN